MTRSVQRLSAKADLPQALLDRLPPESEMGPELRKLPTKRMQLFVLALLDQKGRMNVSAAARTAGYIGNENGLKASAHTLAHDPRIVSAVQELAKKRMKLAALQAEGLLVELMSDTSLDPKLRLSAANSVLDRGGLSPVYEAKITHEHQLGREEKLLRYAELLKKQGRDPRAAFGNLIDLLPDDFKVLDSEKE